MAFFRRNFCPLRVYTNVLYLEFNLCFQISLVLDGKSSPCSLEFFNTFYIESFSLGSSKTSSNFVLLNENSEDKDLTYRGSKIYESYQEEIDLDPMASSIEKENRRNTKRQRAVLRRDNFKQPTVIKYFSETFHLSLRFFEDVQKVSRFRFPFNYIYW